MWHQLRELKNLLFITYGLTLLLLFWVGSQEASTIRLLMRDTQSLGKLPFYAGAISNIGILLWTVTLSVCFFTARLIRQVPHLSTHQRFLILAGAFTTLLMIDDFFLLHEGVFRHHLPVPESIIYAVYACMALLLLTLYRKIILSSEYILFLLAGFLLASSIGVDILQHILSRKQYLALGGYVLEDGFKLAGIITWMLYYSRFCFQLLHQHFKTSR